jgi:hypothetical protein
MTRDPKTWPVCATTQFKTLEGGTTRVPANVQTIAQ